MGSGATERSGRFEVNYGGIWGTACGEAWSSSNTEVYLLDIYICVFVCVCLCVCDIFTHRKYIMLKNIHHGKRMLSHQSVIHTDIHSFNEQHLFKIFKK